MSSQLAKVLPKGLAVQIPPKEHLKTMENMPSGLDDDQKQRLTKVRSKVIKASSTMSFTTLEQAKHDYLDQINIQEWQALFKLIKLGKSTQALAFFNKEMIKDTLYQALLASHDREYIEELITQCCNVKRKPLALADDIVVTHATFEVLMMDLIVLISNRHQLSFSCGLPTHHAFMDKGSGFCSLNKLAILIAYDHLSNQNSIIPVVIGTDVNQDNGLHDILTNKFKRTFKVTHLDVFDSKVYPWPELKAYKKSTRYDVALKTPNTNCAYKKYYAIDLADNHRRSSNDIHPVINYLISNTLSQIDAVPKGKKLALYLPIGWDSHQDENAPCGCEIFVDDSHRQLTVEEKQSMRFNDEDLQVFYNFLKQLIDNHNDKLYSITLFLEGGYTDEVIKTQLSQLLTILAPQKEQTLPKSVASKFPIANTHSKITPKRKIEQSQDTDMNKEDYPYSTQENKHIKR